MQSVVLVNKVCRPGTSLLLPRERLFRRLDEREELPVVWIHAPGGSGKSSLIASYLDARRAPCLWYRVDERDADTASLFYYLGLAVRQEFPDSEPLPLLAPESQPGIRAFSRRFFEALFCALPPSSFLVFDDCHEVAADCGFHEILLQGLLEIPRGIRVLLTSRGAPPPAFIRLRARRKMDIIRWNELRLTPEETAEIVRLHDRRPWKSADVDALHEKTQGWVAGLMLMMERFGGDEAAIPVPAERTPVEVFDYFAEEVFAKTENQAREFLLGTALFTSFSPAMAEQLTGNRGTPRILAELHRNNFFTEKLVGDDIYRYHPLFREFLLKKGEETYTPDVLYDIKRSAFTILLGQGHVEDAAQIARGNEDWNALSGLILKHAESLIKQGRSETVREWLEALPENLLGQSPDLLYWHGTTLASFDPIAGLDRLRLAFDLFRQREERAGMFLAWSRMVNTCHSAGDFAFLDQLAAQMEALLAEDPSFPSAELESMVTMGMFNAMSSGQPHHPDLPYWESQTFRLISSNALDIRSRIDSCIHMIGYNLWMGNFTKIDLVFDYLQRIDKKQIPDLTRLCMDTLEALYEWFKGSCRISMKKADETLRFASEIEIDVMNVHLISHMTSAALSDGDLATAGKMLQRLSETKMSRKIDFAYHQMLLSWRELLLKNYHKATAYLYSCLNHLDNSGFELIKLSVHLVIAEMMHLQGKSDEALSCLYEVRKKIVDTNSNLLKFVSLILEARMLLECGDNEKFPAVLSHAMSIGRKHGMANFIWWQPSVMAALCIKALEEGIEVDYVQDLIRRRNLVPEEPPLHLETWPWAVRVHTLGRFALEVDGEPLEFAGKVQKKPLDLLKIVIASGGNEVPEAQVADALWPDADGDTARHSFKAALHRLRQLIRHEKAVVYREGRLSLDRRFVWVDAWAFEQSLRQAGIAWEQAASDENRRKALALAERALEFYRGPFLCGDENKPWTVPFRERLRGRFLRSVERLAEHWQTAGDWQKGADCCLRGLEADDLAEELYRRLMLCYHQAGRPAEAQKVYRRCRQILLASLGVEPSPVTTRMLSLVGGSAAEPEHQRMQ